LSSMVLNIFANNSDGKGGLMVALEAPSPLASLIGGLKSTACGAPVDTHVHYGCLPLR